MNSVILTLKSFVDSFGIISDAKLKKFYLLPGILNALLIYLLYSLSKVISEGIFSHLESLFKLESYENLAFIGIKIIVAFVALLLYFFVYKALLLIILSPFLSYISERVESHMRGTAFDFSMKDNLRFIWRGIVISAKSFLKESIATMILLLLSIVTPLNLFTPFIIFMIQCYFMGFSFMDYTLERHNYDPKMSTRFLRKNFLYSTINGSIFVAILIIPVFGIFLAPLLSCVSVTIGTVNLLKDEGSEDLTRS